MDVDLSTDLSALLPLVAPLLSGHSDLAIGTRLSYLVKQFVFGYHGSSAAILSVLVLGTLGAFALVAGRALWRAPNPRWRLPLWIGVATIGVPIAAKVFGSDFFFPRNVIASWVPLAVAGAPPASTSLAAAAPATTTAAPFSLWSSFVDVERPAANLRAVQSGYPASAERRHQGL